MSLHISGDSAAIREVLSGRTEAYRAVVDRYFQTVRLVALAKTGNAADAEDVAQETFIKAYETLGVLRNHERLAPWLVSIARNLAVSLVRRRERERRHVDGCPVDPIIHPDHERRETLDAVSRQVDALPENLREVVLLHYFEGLKCREIGERLEMNTNAVVKRLARARALLGDRLLREWAGDREQASPSVHRVMGAIAALPRPDWTAQTAAMGGAATTGGLWAVILGPPMALKLITSISVVALVVLYFVFDTRGGFGEGAIGVTSDPSLGSRSAVTTSKSEVLEMFVRTFANAEDGSVVIDVPPPPTQVQVGFVAGRVVDQDGRPMNEARLSAGSFAASRLFGSAIANPNGDFRINLSTSETKGREKYRPLMVQVSCSVPGYGPVYQSVAMNTSHLELVLLRAAALEGTVIDAATQKPVKEFSWMIHRPIGGDTWPGVGSRMYATGWDTVRSETGSFKVDDVHGIVAVSILAEGYAGARVPVDVSLGTSTSGLVIALEAGQQLAGIVLDRTTQRPMVDVAVGIVADPALAFFRQHTKSDQDGRFYFRDMPTSVPVTVTAKQLGFGSARLTLEPEEYLEPVVIYMGEGGQVSGKVRYRGAPPVKISEGRYGSVYVRGATEEASDYGAAEIQPDGSYIVTGLSDGWYTVEAWFLKSDSGREGASQSKLVEIRDGGDVVIDIDGDVKGGGVEVVLGDLLDVLPLRFEMVSESVPGAVVSSQVEGTRRDSGDEDYEPTVQFNAIEPGFYQLRATDPASDALLFVEPVTVYEGRTETIAIEASALQFDTEPDEPLDEEQ